MGISRVVVLAGLLAAVLVGDVAGVVHVKGEQREAAAAERRAADAAWVADVRAVAEDLLQARAPINDAGNQPEEDDVAAGVRYDVYVRGAVAVDLAGVRDRLAAVRAPGPRAKTHERLLETLERMHAAALSLAGGDENVYQEWISFRAAAIDWERVISKEVADDLPEATTDGASSGLTRAGQLFRWSSACGTATRSMEALPEVSEEPAQLADAMLTEAAVMDDLLTELLAVVPPDVDDAEVQRDLQPGLTGLRETVTTLEELADAVRRLDVDAAEEGFVVLDRLAPLSETVSRFFEARGSTLCSDFFDPGVLLGEAPPEGDLATT